MAKTNKKKSYFETLKFFDGDDVEKLIPLRFIQYMNYNEGEECLYIHLEGKTLTYNCTPEVSAKGFEIYASWCEDMDYSDDALNGVRLSMNGFLEDMKAEVEGIKTTFQTDLQSIRDVAEDNFKTTIDDFNDKASNAVVEAQKSTENSAKQADALMAKAAESVKTVENSLNKRVDTLNKIVDHYGDMLLDTE